MEKCLEFVDNVELEEKAKKLGNIYWAFNLPVQAFREFNSDGTLKSGNIINYMPRKNECCEISFEDLFEKELNEITEQDISDMCDVTIAVLENLTKLWKKFRDKNIDYVYYPNSKD